MTGSARPIVFVESAWGFGGSVVALGRLLGALDPGEFRCHVIVRTEDQAAHIAPYDPASLQVVPMDDPEIGRPPGFLGRVRGSIRHVRRHLPLYKATRQILTRTGARLLHANNGVAANLGAVAAARVRGVPVIVKQHGSEWPSTDVRVLVRGVSMFLADSAYIAAELRALGVREDRVLVTWCPIDPPLPDPALRRRAAIRDELGVLPDEPLVAIVGTLQEWKGQHVFLEAAAQVAAERADAHFVLVGGESREGGAAYGARLRRDARASGIAARTTFLGHRADVAGLYTAFDISVHASTSPEPFGMVVAEAMSCGLPVVATRSGGPSEQIEDGVSGLLVPPGDAPAMAAAILGLLREPARAQAIGTAGRERVSGWFSTAEHAMRTAEIYRSLLST